MKLIVNRFAAVVILFCSVLIATAFQPSTREVARQAATDARDDANNLEELQAALNKLNEAVRLYLADGENLEAARILNRVGRLQLKLNALDGAIAAHNRALDLLKNTNSVELTVDNLNGLAAVYLRTKDKEKMKQVLERAITQSQDGAYKRGEAEALLALSDIQNYDNHLLALQTGLKALDAWRGLDDKPGIAHCYAKIGQYYMAQNILSEARQNYDAALQIWRDLNNVSEQAEVLINFGYIEYRKGNWDGEISYMAQAQSLIDEKSDPEKMGQVASGFGEAFSESGLPELGLPHFERALNYYRLTQDPHLIAIGLTNVGFTHYLMNNYAQAEQVLNDALASAEPNSLMAARTHRFLGSVYVGMQDYDKAIAHFQQALPIYRQAVNPKEAAQVQALLGQSYQQRGDPGRARSLYGQALSTFVRLSDQLNQAAVYFALGRLEMQQDNYQAAEKYLSQSIASTENVRRVSTTRDLTAAFSASVHDRYETYIDCLMRQSRTMPLRRLDVLGFETSELARGRSLAELLRVSENSPAPGVDSQLAERERTLRQSLRARENYRVTLLSKPSDQNELVALDKDLANLNAEYNQVLEKVKQQDPKYMQLTEPKGLSLAEIQAKVIDDDDSLLIEYSLGQERSYVWAVTKNSIASYQLPSEAEISAAAASAYDLLANVPDAQSATRLRQATEVLSQMVLGPIASHLNKRRIVIVADGCLNYIPFQSLPDPVRHNPLISDHQIANAPSASILGQLQNQASQRQMPPQVLAAFGDPVFAPPNRDNAVTKIAEEQPRSAALRDIEVSGDSFNPKSLRALFYAKRELTNLQEIAGTGTLLATGFDATREKLESADLTRFAILHFATHGILDPKRPENSGLFLSMITADGRPQNGFVGLQDIYSLHAPVDLVVLSACRTGLGKDVRGEGLIGLTRGFMYAGASSVVASLWKVDDEATAELMKRFYINMLQRGMKPSEALRAAQNSIRQEPEWNAPYYWAAFTLQGDYRNEIKVRPPHAESVTLNATVIGLGLLVMSLCLYFSYRKMRLALAVTPR